jgi:hypothetical protein
MTRRLVKQPLVCVVPKRGGVALASCPSSVAGISPLLSVNMLEVVLNFHRSHSVSPAWQRDPPSILLPYNLLHLTCTKQGELQGYVLFTAKDDIVRICDLGACETDSAKRLLSSLQKEIYSVNDPTDNPVTAIYDVCNFREYDRQYELRIAL